MAISDKDKELIRQISGFYRSTKTADSPEGSIRETSIKFGLNRNKIRKILITSGDISSPITEKAMQLRKEGLAIKEIAKRLGVSIATISTYLPYEDNIHNSLDPSQHTLDVRNYRAYEKARMLRRSGKKEDKRQIVQKDREAKHTNGVTTNKANTQQNIKNNQVKRLESKVGEYTLPNGLIRIHAALEGVDKNSVDILQKYGCVKHGNTITRDLVVPQDMPLRALHFALQRAFGFQESHLHLFTISEEDLKAVTDDNMQNLLNLRGVIFTQIREEEDVDYEPVYHGGSFKKWLRKQYSYPWNYEGDYLDEFHDLGYHHFAASVDEDDENSSLITCVTPNDKYCRFRPLHKTNASTEKHLLDDQHEKLYAYYIHTMPDFVEEPGPYPISILENIKENGEYVKWAHDKMDLYNKWLVRCDQDDPTAMSIETLRLGDLNLKDGLIAIDERPDWIIERLPIQNVLAVSKDYLPYDETGQKVRMTTRVTHPQLISSMDIFKAIETDKGILPKPFTDRLHYEYDFRDSWRFQITGSRGCSDLVENGIITWKEMMEAVNKAVVERHPVLIAADGDMLIEDVGGIHGFTEFLEFMKFGPEMVINKQTDAESLFKQENMYREDNIIHVENLEESDCDENGMTKSDLLRWAISQGWSRCNIKPMDIL